MMASKAKFDSVQYRNKTNRYIPKASLETETDTDGSE